jgi:hypothetical protein
MSINPIIASMSEKLDSNLYEAFEERAAIMEYEGNLPRDQAECLALLGLLIKHPLLFRDMEEPDDQIGALILTLHPSLSELPDVLEILIQSIKHPECIDILKQL